MLRLIAIILSLLMMTYSTLALCQEKFEAQITIVVNGLGNEGAPFPSALADFWKQIPNQPAHNVNVKHIDYSKNELIDFPIPDGKTWKSTLLFKTEEEKRIDALKKIRADLITSVKVPSEFKTSATSLTKESRAWLKKILEGIAQNQDIPESHMLYLEPDSTTGKHPIYSSTDDIIKYILESSDKNKNFLILYKIYSVISGTDEVKAKTELPVPIMASKKSDENVSTNTENKKSSLSVPGAEPIVLSANTNNDHYAIIEIGSKGVKAAVVQLDRDNAMLEEKDEDKFAEAISSKIIRKKYETLDKNAIHPDSVNEVASAVETFYRMIIRDYQLNPRHIFIVGSSGVAQVSHKERLAEAVNQKVKSLIPSLATNSKSFIEFVSADHEARYGFEGVIRLLPPSVRNIRRKQALFIDIGSGNTKAAYLDEDGKVTTFDVEWGTTSYSKEVQNQRRDREFRDVSAELRESLVTMAIRNTTARKPGLRNLGRIYLVGGIVWGMTNIMKPVDKRNFPLLSYKIINDFHNRVISRDSEQTVCRDNPDISKNTQIDKICRKFTMEDLIAGSDILLAFANELKFDRKDRIAFFRDSLYLWPIGYLSNKIAEEGVR
ncbi:hypothetical protein [Candidatus Magnetaquicoccus inordinatus]|uniref:hypothetical protein n=1 Tax=Candidatus Magnetaquicoccus inordinatus TaxID=2496818 RepID=UPI00102D0A51|nr:hypothetical protein [Candidatus Magnetaquicoccus inordinatus]